MYAKVVLEEPMCVDSGAFRTSIIRMSIIISRQQVCHHQKQLSDLQVRGANGTGGS